MSADAASPIVVLATMRSDFLNAFQLFPGAANRYEEVTLDPMPKARFAALIEGPAQRFGLILGPGLTERLVADTRYDDALPLLAFTLERLYAKGHADSKLTVEEYRDLFPVVTVPSQDGSITEFRGVSAAIKHAADEILRDTHYAGLGEDDPRLRDLRRAFFSLAQVGEAGQFTRRTALRAQMPASCGEVLKRFVDQRLLASTHSPEGLPTLSVAHEALFRVWDTLHGWLLKDRKALTLRSQIEEAAAAWHAEQRPEIRAQLLWPEERILDAVGEIARSGVSLEDVANPELVRAFIGPTDPDAARSCPPWVRIRIANEAAGATATPGACPSATRRGRASGCVWRSSATAAPASAWVPTACRTSTGARSRAARSPSRSARTRTTPTRRSSRPSPGVSNRSRSPATR